MTMGYIIQRQVLFKSFIKTTVLLLLRLIYLWLNHIKKVLFLILVSKILKNGVFLILIVLVILKWVLFHQIVSLNNFHMISLNRCQFILMHLKSLFFLSIITRPTFLLRIKKPSFKSFITYTLVSFCLFIIVIFRKRIIDIFIFWKSKISLWSNFQFKSFIINHGPKSYGLIFII